MNVVYTIESLRDLLNDHRKNGKTIGFIPTMGFLHEGHQSLFKKANETADIVVASVFVNPTQFGPNEDFDSYPRDFEHDQQLAEEAGVDILFHPEISEIYSDEDMIQLIVTDRTNVLCGKSRPGHFDGVVTILTKLFNIVGPNYVFFGKKDAQQVAVVNGLINTFHFPITIVACETVREPDGLAKSSRNVKLSTDERKEAVELNKALKIGQELILSGERSSGKVKDAVVNYLSDHLKLGKVDYVEVMSYPQLKNEEHIVHTQIIALAVFYEKARLIDNVIVEIA